MKKKSRVKLDHMVIHMIIGGELDTAKLARGFGGEWRRYVGDDAIMLAIRLGENEILECLLDANGMSTDWAHTICLYSISHGTPEVLKVVGNYVESLCRGFVSMRVSILISAIGEAVRNEEERLNRVRWLEEEFVGLCEGSTYVVITEDAGTSIVNTGTSSRREILSLLKSASEEVKSDTAYSD